MKTAIRFLNTLKIIHGASPVCIHDLQIYEKESVAFYGLTEDIAEVITNQITGAYSPDQGDVYLNGANSREIPDKTWFKYIGSLSIYNSHTPFRENASAGENIAILFRNHSPGMEESQLSASVLRVANLVQLSITDLSRTIADAGSLIRTKVRLARTLAFYPNLVFLFEPTSDLSRGVIQKLEELIRRTRRKLQYTLVIFTSDIRFLQSLADRVVFLNPITGVVVENQLRGWYHNVLPFLQPSSSKLHKLARDILQYGTHIKVKS